MRFLITAGPTREYLDSVRYLSNGSTGKMGYACAATAVDRGHEVTLISGPTALPEPENIVFVPVVSTEDMALAVIAQLDRCDCLIMAAAPCDYAPPRKLPGKLKKGEIPLTLKLQRTPDILTMVASQKRDQIIIGFAVEDADPMANARKKLLNKDLDAIVLNSPDSFAADATHFHILRRDAEPLSLPNTEKADLASELINLAESLIKEQQTSQPPSPNETGSL